MNTENARDLLLSELHQVEADLTDMRRTVAELHQQIGERWSEPTDEAERANMITMAEQQEAFVEDLQVRRDALRRRLGLE